MIDLNDVALFVKVVRSGSFAEAARQLGMPSNTLGRRVQQLEANSVQGCCSAPRASSHSPILARLFTSDAVEPWMD